jgi:hypothetical protein
MTTPPNPFMNMTFYMDWYWFRDTGLPAEMHFYYKEETANFTIGKASTTALESPSNMTWFDIHITIFNLVPEFTASAILPMFIFATITVIALVTIQAKRKKFALHVS